MMVNGGRGFAAAVASMAGKLRCAALLVALALGTFAGGLLLAAGTAAPAAGATSVAVFPIPGSQVASPDSQITFRGLPASQLGTITVTGSRSGQHTGTVQGDSDGQGASFLPSQPFAAGETVTVHTALNIAGGKNGSYAFTVATPAGAIPFRPLRGRRITAGSVLRFHSAPGLLPAAIKVTKGAGRGSGDLFAGPQAGPAHNGAEIFRPDGQLVWFYPVGANQLLTDFRVQRYQGRRVLTWWQGNANEGTGRGQDMIFDGSYRQVAKVQAGNGLSADLHEFQLTPSGTALITAYYPVFTDASSVHGSKHQAVLDAVVQEIDIPTGLVLFQWDSLDHVPLAASYKSANPSHPFDYFHVNSIQQDRDGTLVISARNTWAVYKVDHRTGQIIWTLGGKRSSFKMGRGAQFAYQHDARIVAAGDRFMTVFDDGAGPPRVHSQSRGLKLSLDLKHHRVSVVAQYVHSPPLLAYIEGNVQQLADGDEFVGWGERPYFTQFNRHGGVVWDAHFVVKNYSYRGYRFPWVGTPHGPPALAASHSHGHTVVYASWNGATEVHSWRLLGGSTPTALKPLATVRDRRFETRLQGRDAVYVEVQALDGHGHVLGQSAAVKPS